MTISLLIGVSAASKLIFGCSFACPYYDAPAEGTDGYTFWWTAYYITLILTLVSKYTDLLWIYIYGEAVIEKKSELESTNATSETQRDQSKSKTKLINQPNQKTSQSVKTKPSKPTSNQTIRQTTGNAQQPALAAGPSPTPPTRWHLMITIIIK